MATSTDASPPIRLATLGEREQFDRENLRAELRRRIGPAAILGASSNESLVRISRQQFEQDDSAVDAFCASVLSRLEIGWQPGTEIERFVLKVLGFKKVPSHERSSLLEVALRDLRRLEELISHYESLPAVARSKDGSRPRDHEAAMHVAFFGRCLNERASISRYLTESLDSDAMHRAEEHAELRRILYGIAPALAEPPRYELASPRGAEYLDWRKINRWRHRVRNLPIRKGRELGELYLKDRAGFYRQLGALRPVEDLFEGIAAAVRNIPRLARRAAIFEELRLLFESSRWMGFYALALPQVEGLFAEMGELAAPKGNKSLAALPEKVRFIRAYAAVHAQNLDYFEYLLPFERNRFAHSGRVDEPYLLALDVLHDLSYVCEVYLELDSPVVELLRLLRDDDDQDLAHWARIFDLSEMVEQSAQLDEVREPLRAFVLKNCPSNESAEALCREIGTQLTQFANHTAETLKTAVRAQLGIEIDLEKPRKSSVLPAHFSAVAEIIDDLRDTDFAFRLSFLLSSIARGLRRHLELPIDSPAQKALTVSLDATQRTLRNIDGIVAASRSETSPTNS